jgi:hypothetical protein
MPRITDRIAALETKVNTVESDVDFDKLGSEIRDVELDLHREIADDTQRVASEKSAFEKGHGIFARFSPSAREDYRRTVGAAEGELDDARAGEFRLHQVKARFFDDKMRAHAREFIRVANKVEREVTGSFEEKAMAAAGRWLAGKSGDDAIEDVEWLRNRAPQFASDADAILAALVSLEDGAKAAAKLTDFSGACNGDGFLAGAALVGGKSASDVRAILSELRATNALPKAKSERQLIEAAALLSPSSARESAATLVAMSGSVASMWDGPAPVIAAAILSSTKPDVALAYAEKLARALSGAEGCSAVIAAGIVAHVDVSEAEHVSREVQAKVAGTTSARAGIAAAAILAHRDAGEAISFAKHVQSQLPGSWESEAAVICAGLLGAPKKPASSEARRAFLLPGIGRPRDEE